MNKEQNQLEDLAEIRSMMERSSRFMSLSGLAGVMAGIYALAGAAIVYTRFNFNPDSIAGTPDQLTQIILTAIGVMILAVGTAVFLSVKNANSKEEKAWNPTSKRLLVNFAVPLFAGGILILILLAKGLTGLVVPLTLIFYGIALYSASKFTFDDVKFLGLIQIILGLIATYFIEYSLLYWAIGFGVVHIVYGLYLHFRYER